MVTSGMPFRFLRHSSSILQKGYGNFARPTGVRAASIFQMPDLPELKKDEDDDFDGSAPPELLHWRRAHAADEGRQTQQQQTTSASKDAVIAPIYTAEELKYAEEVAESIADKRTTGLSMGARALLSFVSAVRFLHSPGRPISTEEKADTVAIARRLRSSASLFSVPAMVAAGAKVIWKDEEALSTLVDLSLSARALASIWGEFGGGNKVGIMGMAAEGLVFQFSLIVGVISSRSLVQALAEMKRKSVKDYLTVLSLYRGMQLPEWELATIPSAARGYWGIEKKAKMENMLKCCLADEVFLLKEKLEDNKSVEV